MIKLKELAVACAILTVCLTADVGTAKASSADSQVGNYVPTGYNLVWSDEFDGNFDQYWRTTSVWDKQQLTKPALFEENGVLNLNNALTAKGEVMQPPVISTVMPWPDGLAPTLNSVKFAWKYGYAEVRIKMRLVDAALPAWWMKSNTNLKDRQSTDWIAETDIAESYNRGNANHSVVKWGECSIEWHCRIDGKSYQDPNAFRESSHGQYHDPPTDGADGAEWVVYGILWTPDKSETYVNGRLYSVTSLKDEEAFDKDKTVGNLSKYAGMQGFRDPAYFIFDNRYKYSEDPTKDPAKMTIDYIRVYQKPGEGDIYIPPQIVTNSLSVGSVGVNYNETVQTLGRPLKDNVFDVIEGKLPNGLTLNANSGVISGRPTKAGRYRFAIRNTNSQFTQGEKSDQQFELLITDSNEVTGNNSKNESKSVSLTGNWVPGAPNVGFVGQMNAAILAVASVVIATGGVIYCIRTRRKRNNK